MRCRLMETLVSRDSTRIAAVSAVGHCDRAVDTNRHHGTKRDIAGQWEDIPEKAETEMNSERNNMPSQ